MPKRIAIVEDEAELASLIEYNLTRHGYESRILGGSKGTLRGLEQYKPDLVLLDVMLPDISGSITSSKTRSGLYCSKPLNVPLEPPRIRDSYPCRVRLYSISEANSASSSTMAIRFGIGAYPNCSLG